MTGKYHCENFSRRPRWRERLPMSEKNSWTVIRLSEHLGKRYSFISISKQVWTVPSMSHDWNSASSREDIISMLRILLLPAVASGARCITKYVILWKKNFMTQITVLLIVTASVQSYRQHRERIQNLCTEYFLLQSFHSIPSYKYISWQKSIKCSCEREIITLHKGLQGVNTSHRCLCVVSHLGE